MNLANVNVKWHDKNKMPSRPTMDVRVKWWTEHMLNCGCRGVPPDIKAEILRRNEEEN